MIPGLLVLLLGVLFLLHNFGFLRFWDLRIYWPLVLIAAGGYWFLDPRSRGFGIAAIGVGVALQASNLGLIRIRDLFTFWPLVLIVVGISLLVSKKARAEGDWVGGAIVLTLGVIFQLQELDWLNVSFQRLWPVLLIVAGLAMLQRALRSR
jgi:hypothetical protein